jgi:hypothetical protein
MSYAVSSPASAGTFVHAAPDAGGTKHPPGRSAGPFGPTSKICNPVANPAYSWFPSGLTARPIGFDPKPGRTTRERHASQAAVDEQVPVRRPRTRRGYGRDRGDEHRHRQGEAPLVEPHINPPDPSD